MMMYLMLGTSVFFTLVGIATLRPVAYLFGANEAMIGDVMTYGTICLIFNTALQAQYTFQSYMTTRAFTICAMPFLVMWLNIYVSSFFTALNNGAVSAAISFMRALVLPVLCITVLPMIWKLDGVWYSLIASEVLGVFVSLAFLIGKSKKYHY